MGELILRFKKEQVIFDVFEAMKHHKKNPQCYRVDVVDEMVHEVSTCVSPLLLMDRVIVNSIEAVEE